MGRYIRQSSANRRILVPEDISDGMSLIKSKKKAMGLGQSLEVLQTGREQFITVTQHTRFHYVLSE